MDEEKSSSLIFLTKNERGMFQRMETQCQEKHMGEQKRPPKKANKQGWLGGNPRVKRKDNLQEHKRRKKMETRGEQG